MIDFMNGLYLRSVSRKGWRKLKSWVEMNVLCIVDEDHQWWVIAVDHTSKFEVNYPILNPSLMVYNTENGASLQKLSDKSQIHEKDIGHFTKFLFLFLIHYHYFHHLNIQKCWQDQPPIQVLYFSKQYCRSCKLIL